MRLKNTIKPYVNSTKDFFSQNLIIVLAIFSLLQVIVSILHIVCTLFVVSNISTQNLIIYIFSFDYISILLSISFFMYYCFNKKGRVLNKPAFLCYLAALIELIVVFGISFFFIISLFFGMNTKLITKVSPNALLSACLVLILAIILNLAQFLFFSSMRDFIRFGTSKLRGARITKYYYYLMSVIAFLLSVNNFNSIFINIILLLTSANYLLKGIFVKRFIELYSEQTRRNTVEQRNSN